jgi:ABC-type antimicrobial peptide transport system permease subunit
MRFIEGMREAADAVGHNKLRTILSLLGMIIGTASVVAIMAAGAMMSHEFIDQADAIGARLIVVYSNWEIGDYQSRRIFMQNRDVDAMRDLEKDALFVRLLEDQRMAVRGSVTKSVSVRGVDPGYWELWPREFKSGRATDETDEATLAKRCVLTEDYADAFFPDGNALGSTLTIGSFDYTVVGITKKTEKESLMNDGSDSQTMFIPYICMERTYNWGWFGSPRVFELMVRAESVERVPSTAESIESYLNRMYGTVDGKCRFKVEQIEGALKAIRTIFAAVTAVVAFIAGISLFVSGIGIMNVMLVAVSERTREIGIRKAIGARASDIMNQFLTESLFICLAGGFVGVALGTLIARAISAIAKWSYVMPAWAPLTALAVSACIGLVFGLVPARNAAALDPVTALTKE